MDSEACDGSSSVPYTSVVHSDDSLNDACIAFAIPSIALTQEPSEALDLRFSASYHCDIDDSHYLNKYRLDLTFLNNLHELTQDYGYEIICKALSRDPTHSSPDEYHQLLFAHRETRYRAVIAVERICSLRRCRIIHICFCIRRFTKSNNNEDSGRPAEEDQLEDCGSMLLRTGIYSDVSLLVGERLFKAHKRILAAHSDVFRAMFSHEMTENQEGVVRIDDLDAEVVGELLAYLYTGRASKLANMPRELFEAAHRYEMRGLRSRCEEFFVFGLDCRNVIGILDMASLYELRLLKSRAMAFVREHESEMVREVSFREFLCRDLKASTVAATLGLCAKYYHELADVKSKAFEYVKEHSREMVESKDFLDLFNSHPDLMREIYIYMHK